MSVSDFPTSTRPIAFLSDIHGNAVALGAVLGELEHTDVGDIYVAGDLLLGGSDPLETWRMLQKAGATCVRGISDNALVTIDPSNLRAVDEETQKRVDSFAQTRSLVGELVIEQVRRLPEKKRFPLIDGREVLLVHGSPSDASTEITPDMTDEEVERLLAGDPADIVVCGCSHVPFQRVIDETLVIGVGSVGESPEGEIAHYTVVSPRMDGPIIDQKWVEYGTKRT